MRHTIHSLSGLFLLAWIFCWGSAATAQESGFKLWPFGAKQDNSAEQQAPAQEQSENSKPRMISVGWPEFKMPSYEMKLPRPNLTFLPNMIANKDEKVQKARRARNAWVKGDPGSPPPWQVLSESTKRVGSSTRSAWSKTVGIFSPGGDNTSMAQREPRRPFWSRLFGSSEAEPEGSKTVAEFLAQERLDP